MWSRKTVCYTSNSWLYGDFSWFQGTSVVSPRQQNLGDTSDRNIAWLKIQLVFDRLSDSSVYIPESKRINLRLTHYELSNLNYFHDIQMTHVQRFISNLFFMEEDTFAFNPEYDNPVFTFMNYSHVASDYFCQSHIWQGRGLVQGINIQRIIIHPYRNSL